MSVAYSHFFYRFAGSDFVTDFHIVSPESTMTKECDVHCKPLQTPLKVSLLCQVLHFADGCGCFFALKWAGVPPGTRGLQDLLHRPPSEHFLANSQNHTSRSRPDGSGPTDPAFDCHRHSSSRKLHPRVTAVTEAPIAQGLLGQSRLTEPESLFSHPRRRANHIDPECEVLIQPSAFEDTDAVAFSAFSASTPPMGLRADNNFQSVCLLF